MQIIGYDIETTGLNPFKDMIVSQQFGDRFYEEDDIRSRKYKYDPIQQLVDGNVKNIIHNAAFELPWLLHHHGVEIVNFEDTMLMAKYLNINAHVTTSKTGQPLKNSFYSVALKPLYENILGGDTCFAKEVQRLGGIDKITRYLFLNEPLVKGKGLSREYVYTLFRNYALADNTMSEALYHHFVSLPKWQEVRGIYELNKSVLMDFAKMRVRGIPVNVEKVEKLKKATRRLHKYLERKLFKITGEFNYDSDEEASAKLKECNVPLSRKNANGFYFTNKDILAPFRNDFPVVNYFIAARSRGHEAEFLNSVTDKWMADDGKVHPDIDIEGSKHGRLACKDPNMMNLKRDGKLRGLFGADPGYDVYFFDWAQQELVGLAYTMGIKTMLNRINNDIDLHRAFAPRIYNKPMEEVTGAERNIAKTGNFQLGYMSGIAKFTTTLNEKAGVPLAEAKKLAPIVHKAFHDEYPEIKENTYYKMKEMLYTDEELQQMHDEFMQVRAGQGLSTWTYRGRKYHNIAYRGYLKNVFGRHVVPEHPSKSYTIGELVVSGGFTGDMTKWKVRTINRYIKKKGYDAHIAMTVHDEIIVHIKPDCARELVPWIKECMEFFPKVTKVVKIKCDVEKSSDGSWSKKGRKLVYNSKKGEWNYEAFN